MMSERHEAAGEWCVAVEDLATVLARPASDPQRRHLSECSRCRALVRELESFLMEPGVLDAGAVAHVDAALHREVFTEPTDRIIPSSHRFHRYWKPALAAAAALLLLVLATDRFRVGGVGEEPLLRGAPAAALSFHGTPEVTLDATGAEGALLFRWDAQDKADSYRVELYDDALKLAHTLDAGSATRLRWTSADELTVVSGWMWRVIAFDRGDPIRQSTLLPLSLAADPGARR